MFEIWDVLSLSPVSRNLQTLAGFERWKLRCQGDELSFQEVLVGPHQAALLSFERSSISITDPKGVNVAMSFEHVIWLSHDGLRLGSSGAARGFLDFLFLLDGFGSWQEASWRTHCIMMVEGSIRCMASYHQESNWRSTMMAIGFELVWFDFWMFLKCT